MCICVSVEDWDMRICVGVPAEARKRVSDPLVMELQVVSCLIWVLSTKLGSSTTETLTHFFEVLCIFWIFFMHICLCTMCMQYLRRSERMSNLLKLEP